MRRLSIHVDGASSGNPGPSGIGVLIAELPGNFKVKEFSHYIGEATNNIAEYTALICGLKEALALKATEIVINTDSELMANQLTGGFKVKNANLKSLYEEASRIIGNFRKVEVRCIPRSENAAADKLANAAVKSARSAAILEGCRRTGCQSDSTKKIRQGEARVIKNSD